MSAPRVTVIVMTRHPDGAISSKDWTPVSADEVAAVEGILGEPVRTTLMSAEDAARLMPVVSVVGRGES